MTKYYCAYCDVYLTHDAPRVRKDHNAGWKHAAQVRAHFLSQNQDRMTRLVGEIVKDYEERGLPVTVPAPITIGRPPVGMGMGGMVRPPPPYAPPPHPGSQHFRPNMPMPSPNQLMNPHFYPFPPGVRPPFPHNLPGQSGSFPPINFPPGTPLPPGTGTPFPPGTNTPFPPGTGTPFPPGTPFPQRPPFLPPGSYQFNPQNMPPPMPPHMMMQRPPMQNYNPPPSSPNTNTTTTTTNNPLNDNLNSRNS